MYDYSGRQNQSFFGLFYRYRVMNGYSNFANSSHKFFVSNPGGRIAHDISGSNFYHEKTNSDFQKFHVIDLRFNYSIKKKINVGFIAPLLFNKSYYSTIYYDVQPRTDSTIRTQGLGDIILFSDYVASWKRQKTKLFVKPGLAMILPTGNSRLTANGKPFPHEMQTGTGTLDMVLRLNGNLRYKNLGVELVANYRLNTKNHKNGYKFGNSLNLMTNPYYVIDITENTSIIPKMGTYAEFSTKDTYAGIKQGSTGGNTWYGNIGFDVALDQVVVQTLFQKPISDRLNGSQMGNAGRLVLGAVYNF